MLRHGLAHKVHDRSCGIGQDPFRSFREGSRPKSGNGTASNPYIHAKAILVDCTATCTKGFVGSENFSAGSLGYIIYRYGRQDAVARKETTGDR